MQQVRGEDVEKISVVVPVLNEETTLGQTLSQLSIGDSEELIIVDGGSRDNTLSIASGFTDKVFSMHKGRGHQMNLGAKKAEGDILLFLHADTVLPEEGFDIIRDVLTNNSIAAGAFFLGIDHPSFSFRIIEWGANFRSSFTKVPYGDQGLFMKRALFEEAGGFADIPLMEDIEISKRLKKKGKIVFVKNRVRVSPRRWLKEGLVYTTLRDWMIAILFVFFKVSPKKLAQYYRDVR